MRRFETRWGILMALPAILGFVIFTIGPMVASFFFSLTDWQIGGSPSFVGLDNYSAMVNDELFWKSLSATTYYTLGAVPLTLIVSFAVAMLLNQKARGLSLWRTIFYLPTLVPAIANVCPLDLDLQPGLRAAQLAAAPGRAADLPVGLQRADGDPVTDHHEHVGLRQHHGDLPGRAAGRAAPPVRGGVDRRGGPLRRFWHVTLPMMTPTIFYNLVVGVVGTFQVFNQAYVMTEGGPNHATLFYVYYLFRKAFTESEMGYASALAWVLFMIIMVVTFLMFRNARRWVYYEMAGAR